MPKFLPFKKYVYEIIPGIDSGCTDCGLDKTKTTIKGRCHNTTNYHWVAELAFNLQL